MEHELLNGTTPVGHGLSESIHLLHLEGVYTWDKSIRLTVKQPFLLAAARETSLGRETSSPRLGDLKLALPLKEYFNLDGRSGSWTLAPQLVIPGGARDQYAVFDRVWGLGLSFGYETETYIYIVGGSATAWTYLGDKAQSVALNGNIGLNLRVMGSSGHLKLKTSVTLKRGDTVTFSAGPTLYWRLTDLWHVQLQWKRDLYDHQGKPDHGAGDSFRSGVAVVF